jgi:hypothetical protein
MNVQEIVWCVWWCVSCTFCLLLIYNCKILHEFPLEDYIYFNNMIFNNNIIEFNIAKHEGGEKIHEITFKCIISIHTSCNT